MLADLHLHSTASDGVLSPTALKSYVLSKGVTMMSLTDHDTMDGAMELYCNQESPLPTFVPGVELSMSNIHGLHLLGYGLRLSDKLQSVLADLKASRFQRMKEMLRRLDQMGIHVELPLDQLNAPGRPHIAREMVRQGVVTDMKEAFTRFLGHGRPAYVPGKKMSMEEAVPFLLSCGYIPVLAHPALLKHPPEELEPLLRSWVAMGLMGVEVYHPANSPEWQTILLSMARRHQLLVTGGSDFHQSGDSHGEPGCMGGSWRTMMQDVDHLKQALETVWQSRKTA